MTYTKEIIKQCLSNGSEKASADKWVVKGMLAIYERQTSDEKVAEETRHHNGIGFNGVDAEILSSFSKQVLAGRSLSPKQMIIARKKMPKYAGQLAKIANGEC